VCTRKYWPKVDISNDEMTQSVDCTVAASVDDDFK